MHAMWGKWGPLYERSKLTGFSYAGMYITSLVWWVNPLETGNPLTSILANGEDPDEMPHNAVFHQGLHCLLK